MTYDCSICLHVNHAKRLHCETCGTVPAAYSLLGQPAHYLDDGSIVAVVVAYGAERLESRRAHKVYFRTVPLDYYAS